MKKTFIIVALAILSAACSKTDALDDNATGGMGNRVPAGVSGVETFGPESDSLALVAVCKAMNGLEMNLDWKNKLNWTEGTPISEWAGVQLNREGRVVGLRLHGWRGTLKGTLAPEIGNLTALKVLDLEGNPNLVGSICPELYNLTELRTLRLRYTGLTGELSEEIGRLTKLDTLDFRKPYDEPLDKPEDEFTGPLPKSIGKLTNLRYLDLDNNEFSGTLPAEWGMLTKLDQLRISSSKLTGAIPDSYKNMKSLKQISLSYNQLDEPLPESLGQLKKLEFLYLSHNKISGSIPASLGDASSLITINLNYNRLTGSIPASLSGLKRLGILWLRDNQLSGTIDNNLGSNGGYMTSMELQNNNLEGALPNIEMTHLIGGVVCCDVEAYNNRLSGVVPEAYMYFEASSRKSLLPQQEGYGFTNLK